MIHTINIMSNEPKKIEKSLNIFVFESYSKRQKVVHYNFWQSLSLYTLLYLTTQIQRNIVVLSLFLSHVLHDSNTKKALLYIFVIESLSKVKYIGRATVKNSYYICSWISLLSGRVFPWGLLRKRGARLFVGEKKHF